MLPTNTRLFSLLGVFAAPLLFCSIPSITLAQSDETPKVSDFTMVLETSEEALHLKCKSGCAWKELTFSAAVGDASQGVDQYGMTPLPRNQSKEQSDLANFVVTIKRTAAESRDYPQPESDPATNGHAEPDEQEQADQSNDLAERADDVRGKLGLDEDDADEEAAA